MAEETSQKPYQVLARKYRPETFADLYGQEAMVRTLKNAFEADRIAHAFIMTGIRGTGKTTTARIVAKGLNCIGADGNGNPTIEPCGVCDQCTAITDGRHVDVIEMDAASRTGVGDIREIIESVHYRAASARFKVYIIDEVHMLSTSAFNALLKTLEEPPEHVKFIFATTEIRKVPVTVLSRCQRFDLRRFEPETMLEFLNGIAKKEAAEISEEALALIVRAAEGSARDALSLLDQAIAHGAGKTEADQVRAMLGLADRGRVLDLFEMVMRGDAQAALNEISAQYADGADPIAIINDLAEITHWVSVVKISVEAAEDPTINPDERTRGLSLAEALPMRALTRMWQMLLKSLEEVAQSPNAMMAAEMAIIRLTHVAELPSPDDLVRKLKDAPLPSGGGGIAVPSGGAGGGGAAPNAQNAAIRTVASSAGTQAVSVPDEAVNALARYVEFADVVKLIRTRRDMKLLLEVEQFVRLVSYRPGFIEFEPADGAPTNLAAKLSTRLQNWTGVRWGVSIVSSGGQSTLAEDKAENDNIVHNQAINHPMVAKVFDAFPGAEIKNIRPFDFDLDETESVLPIDPDDVDDDWNPLDPFEE